MHFVNQRKEKKFKSKVKLSVKCVFHVNTIYGTPKIRYNLK